MFHQPWRNIEFGFIFSLSDDLFESLLYEHYDEKTCLQDSRSGPTHTGLHN